jgi:basic membrane protein A
MKRVSVLVIVFMVAGATLWAAGNGSAPVNPNDKSKQMAVVLVQGGLGDKGYNDDAKKGLDVLKKDFGMESVMVEPADLAQGETYLRQLGDSGYGAIVSLEYGIKDAMYKVAAEYPKTIFVIFGKYAANQGLKLSDNVVEIELRFAEHSYLAGLAAAFVATDGNEIVKGVGTRKGANIGMICATESLGFYRYHDGFMQGAKSYNPDCNVYTDYNGGFTDTQNVKTIAENMIKNKDCDVIWTCCGTAGLGGLQAARINKAFGIGVDSNQDYLEPGTILTSVMRKTDLSIIELGKRLLNGTLKGSVFVCNVANRMLDISDMSTIAKYVTNQKKFAELVALIDKARQDIASGKIKVIDAADGVRYEDYLKQQAAKK